MGGGIGMGSTCKPMAVSFQCMTKFTTNKKKKERELVMTEAAEHMCKTASGEMFYSPGAQLSGL